MSYEKSKLVLNQAVADLSAMSALIHQIHWYMRGEDFLHLHPQMDEYRDAIEGQLDEISERLITLGGAPWSTLTEFSENSKIKLESGLYGVATTKRFEELVLALRYLSDLYKEGISTADGEDDYVTSDIFHAGLAWLEKTIWMLQAELGKEPEIA
ncbi:MAG: DNA starvation/stationary phase protection protein [Streptococcaceae bacterium]|jgi:starvation-inducible DNA-binding protein|nr:DNA starvation/stationary phase protection protein [Streptococcaceae bacterium]